LTYLSVDERREQFIKAAVDVIASEGLARATTRRIAEEAGAPLGAVHYCFKNKDELVRLLANEAATMMQSCFGTFDPQAGVEATIRNDIEALWRWYRQNIGLQLALLELGMNRLRRGGTAQEVYAMWDPFGREVMIKHLQEAQKHDTQKLMLPIPDIVRFILHRFDGLTLEFAASRDVKACQRQIDMLADAMVLLAVPKPAQSKTRAKKR
jgi:AcrR family transcriptional regulator